jgi:hypothetical protein
MHHRRCGNHKQGHAGESLDRLRRRVTRGSDTECL